VKLLIAGGAKVDVADTTEYQPLHFAAVNGRKDVAEFLIGNGAPVDAVDDEGWQPLHFAAWEDDRDMIKLLLGHGADPTALNDEGKTPFQCCSSEEIGAVLEAAEREWDMAEHLARQRKLGSLRPRGPTL